MIRLQKHALVCGLAASCLLMSAPAHSQSRSVVLVPATVTVPNYSQDDADINLSNPPLSVKYMHGIHFDNSAPFSSRRPAPEEPQARARYAQAETLLDIGFAYLCYHRYDKAIDRFQRALAIWPDSAPAYRWLAETYQAKGDNQEAIANYRLLFYGWPGQARADPAAALQDPPADRPRGYDTTDPAEVDPTLLMQFSLLLQQTGQRVEAQKVYERGMHCLLMSKKAAAGVPLPPLLAAFLPTPASLEAATRTALAIYQATYGDVRAAKENLSKALLLEPGEPVAQYHQAKMLQEGR